MKLRKAALLLLFVTVLSPIVLYTDTLGTYIRTTPSSSGNAFIKEEAATFDSATLYQDSFDELFDENSAQQGNSSAADSGRTTRQLAEEAMDHHNADDNPIRQVVGTVHQDSVSSKKSKSSGEREAKTSSIHISGEVSASSSNQKLISSGRTEHLTSGGRSGRHPIANQTVKRNEQIPLPDILVRQLKDQLIRARVYLSLSALKNNPHFIRELRLRMKEVQRALGDATKDSELPRNALMKLKSMEETLAKGRQIQDDCSAVVKKLRAMLHSAEEQLRVHKKQTLFLSHLSAKTLPKGLHCLPLRLSTEYFTLNTSQRQFPYQEKLEDSRLYHYAIFSDNILAAAVVVNSTVSNAKDASKHVFHVVTDRLNYAAMRMWFLANPPRSATIHIQSAEEFAWLNSSYSPALKQMGSPSMIDFYFKARRGETDSNMKFRNPKYLSIMNHLRFYLPEIFPMLDKILFLDDDVVVKKDLTDLWSVDLNGKVISVVETCGESFHRFDRYLNFSNPIISREFDPRACGWAFGMNLVDLKEWKRQNITEVYHSWQNLNHDRQLWKLGTLPPGLITFWNRTYPLDRSWHVLGLGYNPNVSQKEIDRAAVIHYNGNLKPWLEIGIPKFRTYWAKYVDYDQLYLRECNINA